MDLLLPLIILLPLGLLIYQQRKRQRAFAAQQALLEVGQTVMTTAGLYGVVVEVDDDMMVLEAAPGVRLRWNKAAVGRILTADSPEHPSPLGTEGLGGTTPAPDQPRTDSGPDLTKN